MRPLWNMLPVSDGVLFVFCDFETTQDSEYSDSATVLTLCIWRTEVKSLPI